jgi:hypothetical protein
MRDQDMIACLEKVSKCKFAHKDHQPIEDISAVVGAKTNKH